MEEEYLMFTVEIADRTIRRQDGPHQTLRWRNKVRKAARIKQRVSVKVVAAKPEQKKVEAIEEEADEENAEQETKVILVETPTAEKDGPEDGEDLKQTNLPEDQLIINEVA